MTAALFEPEAILAALEDAGVKYVVIGGLAAILQGAPTLTQDLDICPARDVQNLERLAVALRAVSARIRTSDAPDGIPFACDAEFFARVELVNLVTRYGELDVAFIPSGTTGYEELVIRARPLELSAHLAPPIAALEDIIRSKEAAGRPKDIAVLPTLRTLLAEITRRGG
jgi:hypothetical protein